MREGVFLVAFLAVVAAILWVFIGRRDNDHRTRLEAPRSEGVSSRQEVTALSNDAQHSYIHHDEPRTSTPWVENPQQPAFKVTVNIPGGTSIVECAPKPWASHRRTFSGWAWPNRSEVHFDFADVNAAIDLRTGEVLNATAFWTTVLSHREDEPPIYVIYAQAIPVLGALAGFSFNTRGRFGERQRDEAAKALSELDYVPPPREVWSQLINYHHSRSTATPLNKAEIKACHYAARRIAAGTGRKPVDPEALELAKSMFPIATN